MQGYLGSLGDLNHSHPFVQQQMLSFVTGLVEDYSVDAFRLDTVVYVDLDFVKAVQQVSWPSSGCFLFWGSKILTTIDNDNDTCQESLEDLDCLVVFLFSKHWH